MDAVRYINGADLLWTARDRASVRQQEKTDAKYPELIPEFGAVYAWSSRDRVIIERMTVSLAREAENLLRNEGVREAQIESDRYGRYHWSLGLECV